MVVAVLSLGFFAAGVPSEFAVFSTVCQSVCTGGQLNQAGLHALRELGLTLDFYAAYAVVLDPAFAAAYAAVAAAIFWRKPADPMALLASFALLTFGTANFPDTMSALAAEHPSLWWPVAFLNFVGAATFSLFLYLFPDGRFVPRWTRWVALAWIAWQVPKYWFPGWAASDLNSWPGWLAVAVWTVALGTVVYAQAYRYQRVSDAARRRQIKWVVFGISAAVLVFLGMATALSAFAPTPTSPGALRAILIGYAIVYAGMLLIPLSIGVAILRQHLWDIDLIINRALVYGALTASVVLLYVLVVGGLGEILRVRGNLIVSLLATGLAAVLFQPLRYRLQRGVNRLMYGERDEPYEVLSRLGSRLESTLAPDAVLPAVAKTVKEALKLPYVEVQLKRADGFATVAASGEPADGKVRLPLVYGGETVGRLVLAPRTGESGFAPAERRLLEDLAHQGGASAHSALMTEEATRLSADLQRSRERLVEAREEERRRLRRDLHDGLGPQLSSQALTIDAVRALMRQDPDAAEALLVELKADAQDAVTDIRRLVYGLRPPALDDLGLFGALRETAEQYRAKGLNVSVETPKTLPPLSAAVEVAAYRIAQEALTNVARHAGADSCTVSLAIEEAKVLSLEVRDDGCGMPDLHEDASLEAGVGLTSMRERASELGGSLLVEPLPDGGTLVRARLPLPKEE
jgi:signal transduction histidine kinase